jgi:hypothetical protein
MTEDLFKIVGILIISFFIIYIIVKMFQLQTKVIEGLTNADGTIAASTSGEAGTATSYAASVKAQVVKLQDELLIAKYRKDYETTIINLDDYIGMLMIKQTLNMKIDGDIKTNISNINNLNVLKMSKDSLNATMTFLDKQ